MANPKIKLKVTVTITVLNEAESIVALLESLKNQTYPAHEVIITDGGSVDSTLKILKNYKKKHQKFPLKIISNPGNRSSGRNTAIESATTDWIAITDGGCTPEPEWLEELVLKQKLTGADVIAGYYSSEPETDFEQAMVPYALVMPGRLDESNFLPATRSMMISKRVWQEAGGFNERLTDNEDFVFAKHLQQMGVDIEFARKASVIWQPRSNLREFYLMVYRFARGDLRAGIVRPKVLLIFFRYLVAFWILMSMIKSGGTVVLITLGLGFLTYAVWAIEKNYRYAKSGWYWLPVLQISSDMAVMTGSLAGLYRGLKNV